MSEDSDIENCNSCHSCGRDECDGVPYCQICRQCICENKHGYTDYQLIRINDDQFCPRCFQNKIDDGTYGIIENDEDTEDYDEMKQRLEILEKENLVLKEKIKIALDVLCGSDQV